MYPMRLTNIALITKFLHLCVNLSVYYDDEMYITIDEFSAAVVTMGFISGAYIGETFRGALLSVDKGQLEAITVVLIAHR